MIRANDNFRELPAVYLFTKISRRLAEYKEQNGNLPLIRMDIGDIPGPIPDCVAKAMHKAVDDLTTQTNFHGYGPEQGYSFLRDAIAKNDYADRGIDIKPTEIFISDGAKCDLGNLGDILSRNLVIAVMNPSYPAYIDDNVIDGRTGNLIGETYSRVVYLKCSADNSFHPELPKNDADIIYICSPNNPTGTCLPATELTKWVEYAHENGSLIIFDSAYESYVRTPGLPKSIYEIEGAKEVAIEVRSFSKTGGFTGVRCGYTVIPEVLKANYSNGESVNLNRLWSRRQTTKFNGASYVSQRGAEALYTDEGKIEVRKMTDRYIANASKLGEFFRRSGWKVTGGVDSPYLWVGSPWGEKSVDIFENILINCGVSTTPGSGFGSEGEGFLRLSGFNSTENTDKAIDRLARLF